MLDFIKSQANGGQGRRPNITWGPHHLYSPIPEERFALVSHQKYIDKRREDDRTARPDIEIVMDFPPM